MPGADQSGAERIRADQSGAEQKKRAPRAVCTVPALPPSLDTPEVNEAVKLWHQFRVEIKHPVTPSSWKALYREYEEKGSERLIRAINHTVAKGWQGLVEPDIPRGTVPLEEDWTKGLTIIPSKG